MLAAFTICASGAYQLADRRVAALYPVYLLLSPIPVAWPAPSACALLVVVGLVLFARELIGGGDVKLIAALSLWAGLEHFVCSRW